MKNNTAEFTITVSRIDDSNFSTSLTIRKGEGPDSPKLFPDYFRAALSAIAGFMADSIETGRRTTAEKQPEDTAKINAQAATTMDYEMDCMMAIVESEFEKRKSHNYLSSAPQWLRDYITDHDGEDA